MQQKNEKTDLNTALSADYDQYVLELINCLKERNFDIYLIPHVGEDGVNSFSEIEELIHILNFQIQLKQNRLYLQWIFLLVLGCMPLLLLSPVE